jgi:adenosyl cobinamide kinase/adenosyl cobinamide phosphate guanylyltransferase
MPFVLLLGGVRSGKSALALEIAARAGDAVTVVATAEARDEEMERRIARHRADRPTGWTTIEEPFALGEAVRLASPPHFLIVDCLTLWVSNLLARGDDDETIASAGREAAAALAARPSGAVVVSNEVGLGIVPANPVARRFRDALGAVNAAFAARADRAAFLVAGRVCELGPAAEFMEGIQWRASPASST